MPKTFRALACVAALWILVSTFAAVARLQCALPTYDHWAAMDFADDTLSEGLRWQNLWVQHNEHRLLVPRLLFLVDFFCCGGRGTFLLVTTALLQLAHALLLWRLAIAAAPLAAAHRVTTAALVVVASFSAAQMFNFIEPFQVQFMLVHAAATLALWAAVRASGPAGNWRWWLLALAGALVAALSMANGLVVAPLLVGMAWALRARGVHLAVVAGIAAVIAGGCLVGFDTGAMDPAHNVRRPWRVLAYAACWVGSPFRLWNGEPQVVPGGLVGIAAMLAFLVLAAPILGRRHAASTARYALAAVGVFLLVTAFSVAVGRSNFALAQAQNDRYATPCHVFWVVLGALGAGHAQAAVRALSVTVVAALALALAWQQRAHIDRYELEQSGVRAAELAVLSGVRDEASMQVAQIASWVVDIYDHWLGPMQHRRWSVYADAEATLVGQRVVDRFTVAAPAAALGGIDLVEPVAGTGWGCRVQGWAWDAAAGRVPERVLLVAGDDVIVGLADTGRLRRDVQAGEPAVTDAGVGFAGYAAVSTSCPRLRAWIVHADGRVSPCGAVHTVEAAALATAPAAGTLTGAHFLPLGPLRPLAADPAASALGIVPVHATLDEQFGRIDVGPLPQRAGFVGLPVQVGPCPWALSLHLVDLVTFREYASIHPPPTHGGWAIWRVEITPDMLGGHLGFLALDRGARPGQWLAVGRPVAVP